MDQPLKEISKFLKCQTDLVNDVSQSSFGDSFVVGHSDATKRREDLPENHVAALLMVELVPDLTENFGEFAARKRRQMIQADTSTISSEMGGGTGSPCFARLSRYA